jgi:hypothetical protein
MKEVIRQQLPGKIAEVKEFRKNHGGDSVSFHLFISKLGGAPKLFENLTL